MRLPSRDLRYRHLGDVRNQVWCLATRHMVIISMCRNSQRGREAKDLMSNFKRPYNLGARSIHDRTGFEVVQLEDLNF